MLCMLWCKGSALTMFLISTISTIKLTLTSPVHDHPNSGYDVLTHSSNHDSLEPNLEGLRIRHCVTLTGNNGEGLGLSGEASIDGKNTVMYCATIDNTLFPVCRARIPPLRASHVKNP